VCDSIKAAASSRGILQSPSNCAPSFSTKVGVVSVQRNRAVGNNSMRSRAIISPLTLPPIVSRTAAIRALTTAPGAITISLPLISPSASPSILPVWICCHGTRPLFRMCELRLCRETADYATRPITFSDSQPAAAANVLN
jgi:hypothetical protein